MPARLLRLVALATLVGTACAAAGGDRIDYGRDIRPILSENCFYCHGQDASKRKGKLRLDTLDGQRSKEAVVPGRPDDSEIIKRLASADPDEQMPPPDSHRTVTPAQREQLRRWIADGAPFDGHWAFAAPQRPAAPEVRDAAWPRNPVDRFVLAKLEAAGLRPSPEAARTTLIRRVTLDLTGLPPTPEEVDAFLADPTSDAYERVVDRLLASPHYGERMALPWLDAARYADSNGFQQDGDTFQWIWRDWVVAALNANLPFDRFTIEQLAGDLLPEPTVEQRIATGFNRNHLLNGEGGAIPEEQRYVTLFDRVDVTATTWLGLTVACAQCHDHKYDPITRRDYYAMMAAFNNLPENGLVNGSSHKVRLAEPLLDVASPEHKARLAELDGSRKQARELRDAEQAAWELRAAGEDTIADQAVLDLLRQCADPQDKARNERLKRFFDDKVSPTLPGHPARVVSERERAWDVYRNDEYPRVMVMADTRPRDTHVLDRGNYEAPLEKVACDTPGFLPPLAPDAPRNRLGWARWLVSPDQPLTARVVVNRYWQLFFGMGLVKTSEDFGVQSEAPIHGALLDWLAVEFREGGWDMKALHRLLVTSGTYRQGSAADPALRERDPENRLYARAPRFRLPAMLIRDQALAASGLLDARLGGKPVYPYQPKDIWDSLAITKERDFTYPQSTGSDLHRRSLYTFFRRTVAPSNLFDASSRNTCQVRTAITSTPLHALTVLNDPTFVEAARALAARTWAEGGGTPAGRIRAAFRRVLARPPDATEAAVLSRSLDKQLARFTAEPQAAEAFLAIGSVPRDAALPAVEHAAHAAVCLAILNLDEALCRE